MIKLYLDLLYLFSFQVPQTGAFWLLAPRLRILLFGGSVRLPRGCVRV